MTYVMGLRIYISVQVPDSLGIHAKCGVHVEQPLLRRQAWILVCRWLISYILIELKV